MVSLSIYCIAILFAGAGTLHWLHPDSFARIMPPYIPFHHQAVLLSGSLEIILGLGVVFVKTRNLCGWGLILLLLAVFPANLYMFQQPELFHAIPRGLLLLRLPLQFALAYWVYWATLKPR